MNNYRQILYHLIFNTYNRQNTLPEEYHEDLYKYIWGVIKNRNGVLYQINGTENHIHLLCDLHPSIALADLIKEIKIASNRWMKSTGNFQTFSSWGAGYCALSYSYRDKEMIIQYIKNQKEHHRKQSFDDELRGLLREHGIAWDERYLF